MSIVFWGGGSSHFDFPPLPLPRKFPLSAFLSADEAEEDVADLEEEAARDEEAEEEEEEAEKFFA